MPRATLDDIHGVYRETPSAKVPIFGGLSHLHRALRVIADEGMVAAVRGVVGEGRVDEPVQLSSNGRSTSYSLRLADDGLLLWVHGTSDLVVLNAHIICCAYALAACEGEAVHLGVEATISAKPHEHSRNSFKLPPVTPLIDPDAAIADVLALVAEQPTGNKGTAWRRDVTSGAALAERSGGSFMREVFLLLSSVQAYRVDSRMAEWIWQHSKVSEPRRLV